MRKIIVHTNETVTLEGEWELWVPDDFDLDRLDQEFDILGADRLTEEIADVIDGRHVTEVRETGVRSA